MAGSAAALTVMSGKDHRFSLQQVAGSWTCSSKWVTSWENARVTQQTSPESDSPVLDPAVSARLKRDGAGLVAAIVQQFDSKEVLMLGWMDDEALRRTLAEGRVTFYSRSRQEYWRKGDTSGHYQFVKSVELDCDGDALLLQVDQVGAACHTGERTCFLTGGHLEAHVIDEHFAGLSLPNVPESEA